MSKSKVNKEFVKKPAEFFQNSTTNFLENERSFVLIERGCVNKDNEGVKIKEKELGEVKKESEFSKKSLNNFLENERYYESKNLDENHQKPISQSQERYVFSSGSLQRYVTTCYFQPKQIPVSYSETMILKIGSSKKKFFESVYCKNTLLPSKWSESMHTTIKRETEPKTLQTSEIYIPIEKSTFNYVSLEPQQIIAQEVAQEITAV
ncbi:uncharacterized protein [Onthophagus taurus]|uniref:uncharacterized protein n=1 Tax=Onthophagus taurus TaxID=166361 RepID=UPI000C1FFA87|nr:uncharacterized protein LOC111427290 [Onthophagus taurus]